MLLKSRFLRQSEIYSFSVLSLNGLLVVYDPLYLISLDLVRLDFLFPKSFLNFGIGTAGVSVLIQASILDARSKAHQSV